MLKNMKNEENERIKELLVEQLKKTPIIQVACEKIGLPRATFYRWKSESKIFSKKINEALFQGKYLINDMAESQLISKIGSGNLTAIIYWLNNNHRTYRNKLELGGKIKTEKQKPHKLTKTQLEMLKQGLMHGGIIPKE